MVQAKDLRIGNWVSYIEPDEKPDGTILGYEVFIQVDLDFLVVIHHNDVQIYGIPLTPEILKKAGALEFYKSEWQIKYELNNFTFAIKNNRSFLLKNDTYLTELSYVHQLQNLYFCLTGEELQITL